MPATSWIRVNGFWVSWAQCHNLSTNAYHRRRHAKELTAGTVAGPAPSNAESAWLLSDCRSGTGQLLDGRGLPQEGKSGVKRNDGGDSFL